MSRNSSGNYTLPSGNPVVGGTTISTTWANATLGDLQSEMTDSLCRSGKGAMLAPLQIADGTAAAPSLTWAGDPDSGIYRAGAGDVRMQVDATQTQKWTATGSTVPVPLTVTTAIANTVGLTVTGNGMGVGISATGGATSANAVAAVGGAPNGDAVYGQGTGTGTGVVGAGGTTSGPGVEATGGAPNGVGLIAIGTGTGYGLSGRPGTAATASARSSAVVADAGDVVFTNVTNPNSNVAFSNTLTAMNTPKAWAVIQTTGGGSTAATILAGFNVTSASVSTTLITLTLAQAMASTNFSVSVTPAVPGLSGSGTSGTASTVLVSCKNLDGLVVPTPNTSGTAIAVPLYDFQAGVARTIYVHVFGAQ